MSKRNCKKCGARSVKQWPTFTATLDQPNDEPVALVQFREFISLEVNGTPTNFHTAQVVYIPYSIVTAILNTPEIAGSFYFKNPAERFEYLIEHPEHEGKNI